MGGTRKNPSRQAPPDIAGKLSEMEAKFQQGLDKLREDYITNRNNSESAAQDSPDFKEKLKLFELQIEADMERLKEEILFLQ
ncbi:hypothetical protein WA026_023859 [Henosepilachna vigintioctopunctata]|uniref:Uncharacterized protein n=1 Tax=Henosepilachna vigintioctopunctata TaxID=420089 RepID=A0AAW1TTT5_9CUCU